jgi:hypothetical protein
VGAAGAAAAFRGRAVALTNAPFRRISLILSGGNSYLTVTNPANETTKTFKVTSEIAIAISDGKSSQSLNLIEGTLVAVDVDLGDRRVAAKITVLPAIQEPP